MKKILLYALLLSVSVIYGQRQAANWYFGENAGIQFDASGNITVLDDGQLDTYEGCSSISDNNGNLLFYTDGTTVFNRLHRVMANGTGLLGDASSSQSAIVVPKPDDPDIYYIFTVGSNSNATGLKYSIVDMTAQMGFGEVTIKNENLLFQCAEKIAAVLKDCETGAIWVIALSNISGTSTNQLDTFHAFQVTDAGVNTTPVVSNFDRLGITDQRGYLKLSPDGTKVACASVDNSLLLFDFDVNNGQLSNGQFLTIPNTNNQPYGAEFSPNSQVLYVTASNDVFGGSANTNPDLHRSVLVQYNLAAADIQGSAFIVDNRNLYRSALQLGPNGKIYRSMAATYEIGLPFLSAINNPNELGDACNYENNAISLGNNNSTQGLPPFIASFFTERIDIIGNGGESTFLPLCTGDTYTLTADDIPGATYEWTKDNVILPEVDFSLTVTEAGIYEVKIDLNNGDCEFLEGEAVVEYFEIPVATQPNNVMVCDSDNDAISTFDLTTLDSDILDTLDATTYSVHYFESPTDAANNDNEITGTFTNTINPTPIYARVHNDGNPNCYDTTTFELNVFNTPIANTIANQRWCDNADDGDAANGQVDIDLLDFNTAILDTQNPADYSISYHNSIQDAIDNVSPLPDVYYNQTPFQEEIFVRIENDLNTDCFDTTSFNVIIDPVPDSFNTSLIQCDVDGINDGLTTFNLNEAIDNLTGSNTNVFVEFYESITNANSSTGILNASGYVNTTNPEVVYAKVINNDTNCFSISELSLEVSTTQINNFQVPAVCDELDSEDGINTFNLSTITAAIQAENSITFPVTYYESYNDALLEQNELASPYTNTTAYNQTLYSRVENNNACYGISEVSLTINMRPELDIDESYLYCLNYFPQTISINAGVLNDSPSNYTYQWSSGENTYAIDVNETGNYTVTVTNNVGCTKTRTLTIEPSNIATIESININDALQGNNTISVIVSGEGNYEYALYDQNDALYAAYQSNNVFTNVDPGIYTVRIRDIKNNCGIVEDMVSVIGFPKVFTPNGDGSNDTWNVQGVSSQFQPNTRILIFNRYGKLLKELSPLNGGWDGTYNGEVLPVDDYWFSVTLQDGRIYKNHFTLKR